MCEEEAECIRLPTQMEEKPKEARGLRLKYVNLELQDNQQEHNTQGLSGRHLVVRRGQEFKITLFFSGQTFSAWRDSLSFKMLLGSGGQLMVEIPVIIYKDVPYAEWSACVQPGDIHSHSVTVHIITPPSSPIGVYDVNLDILHPPSQRTYFVGSFILLCNPWCQFDSVYIPYEEQRNEYVKNDLGFTYTGTPQNIVSRPWFFGQYEDGVLEICLNVLRVSLQHCDQQKEHLCRADPVHLSRVICKTINCQCDNSILWRGGPWAHNSLVHTSEWTGSAEVLRLWAGSQFCSVQYSQCWVSAAVLCTVMRVLGIPSRVVTIFDCANDTNGNFIIEEIYTEKGGKLPVYKDRIWSFHAWVECWMRRPDLQYGFDGWQVLDPTPQERNRGLSCRGPCPVRAIRNQCLNVDYDASYIHVSLNANVLKMIVKDGHVVDRTMESGTVGSLICTKAMGSHLRITHQSLSSRTKNRTLEAVLHVGKGLVLGDRVCVTITVRNWDRVMKTVKMHVDAHVKPHILSAERSFWHWYNSMQMAPHEVKVIEHWIPYSQYGPVLAEDDMVQITVVLADELNREWALVSEEFSISSPQIFIQVTNVAGVVLNRQQTASVTFRNPLPVAIQGAELTVEGPGLIQEPVKKTVYLLQPGKTLESTIIFTPTSTGTKMLQAILTLKNSPTTIRNFQLICVKPC